MDYNSIRDPILSFPIHKMGMLVIPCEQVVGFV